MPQKAALTFLKIFLYCNKPVYLDTDVDRRPNNDDAVADRSNSNLTEKLEKSADWILKIFRQNSFKSNCRFRLE